MARYLFTSITALLLISASVSLRGQQAQGNLSPQDQAALQESLNQITIPEGTEFKVQLHTSISSKTAKVGDRMISTLIQPVTVEDMTVLHKGLRVYGHVSDVKQAGRHGKGGYLAFQFDSIEMPNGEKVAILGSLTEIFSSANNGSVNVGPEGDLKGGGASRKKQMAMFLGPTAAAAAGGLAPVIAIGVASGMVAILVPKGKPAVLLAGSLLGMRLDEDVTLNVPPAAINSSGGDPKSSGSSKSGGAAH
jgi:hypothetical protein